MSEIPIIATMSTSPASTELAKSYAEVTAKSTQDNNGALFGSLGGEYKDPAKGTKSAAPAAAYDANGNPLKIEVNVVGQDGKPKATGADTQDTYKKMAQKLEAQREEAIRVSEYRNALAQKAELHRLYHAKLISKEEHNSGVAECIEAANTVAKSKDEQIKRGTGFV